MRKTPFPRPPRRIAALALVTSVSALTGCQTPVSYLVQQGYGQLMTLLRMRPIDDVLASGKLDAEQRRKLELVVSARQFAQNELGLNVGRSYHYYHDTGGEPVAYNLSAARKDALVAKTWRFPIIGEIEYIGYFSRADADAAAAELAPQGYDTYIYSVDAFSTAGWLPDPVYSTFLRRSDGSIVETVIHELAHNTVYAPGRSTFNESLATYIGRLGARLYYERQGAQGKEIIAALEANYADAERITAWMQSFETELRALYAEDISSEEKIAGRAAIFEAARQRFQAEVIPQLNDPDRQRGWGNLPTNNAFVLLYRRYNLNLDVFSAAYERAGQNFAAFLDRLRSAADSDDPFAHLSDAAGSP